jgi:hypothetical protein
MVNPLEDTVYAATVLTGLPAEQKKTGIRQKATAHITLVRRLILGVINCI